MKKVVVQFDNKVKIFENVTKVQCYCAGDFFDASIKIHQGDAETVINLYEIIGFEVKEN